MLLSKPTPRCAVGVTIAIWLIATLAPPAAAGSNPRQDLATAEDLFLVADFSGALTRVDSLLESGVLGGGALRDAWILRARCEAGLAHRATARDAFCEALRVDAGWRPDTDLFTSDEIALFDEARTGCTSRSSTSTVPTSPLPERVSSGSGGGTAWYAKKTTWIVAGGLIAAGIATAALGGGGDEELAGFPPPPGRSIR
ncbi:MAG: hypothetical protein KC591_17395 [Gemmatimonadetes bacterium]|nr:hypothetical protein [Gemmatimonadota bacterium]